MQSKVHVANNLLALRQRHGLSQENIANYLGIARPMVSYYETGERNIPLEHLEKLADFFGIDAYDLLDENPSIQQSIVAFAFRADELNADNMNGIAAFRKVVRNYLKMKEVSKKMC
ncbi:helix-turn-helix transcriptional regulator [Arcicella aquatica]|uniref:Helix-turn-helix transcriptional regulator n=1 Tax=Arcicella aquatica TaxID=217141 RepID=A0ABU5QU62_9BACT|nr:helix-turn-helix transcriptional regulator [Arcicella aquatica]MEA5260655.1 helix-turn-helix transcriptional regulator [Arcicella aquatica]